MVEMLNIEEFEMPVMGFTFSHVASLVIVTELKGLVDPSGGTAGHCGSEQTFKSQERFCSCHSNSGFEPPITL